MIFVGSYRYTNEHYKTNLWKFKSSFEFIKQYMKDGCPYTMYNRANGTLQCKGYKNRTYFDLFSMCEAHVEDSVFSKKEFNKSLKKALIKGVVKCMFCPYIDHHVFYKGNGCKNIFIKKIKHSTNYLLIYKYINSTMPYKSKMLFKFIFKEQLGFIIE